MNASHSIGRLKSYPAYKPSGVEWLEEVPEHWEVRRLKQICQLAYGDSLSAENRAEGDIPVYGSNGQVGVHNTANTLSPCIIIGRKGSFGKVSYLGRDAFAIDTTFFIDDRHTNADLGWLSYALPLLGLDQFSHDSAVPGLNRNDAYERILPLPPLPEQHAIVRYLDYVDRRIRRYTSAKRKLIALLEEERQAVVNQAVTRGLYPNVRLKPSGVEWLGDVPEHWEVRRLKTLGRIRYGLGQPPRESVDGPPLIRATNVERGRIVDRGLIRVDPSDVPATRDALLRRHEIIVVRSGAYTADSAIIPTAYDGAVAGYDLVVTATGCMAQFMAQALLSTYLRNDQLITASSRAAQPHLNAEELGASMLLVPPIYEQRAIVEHLDKATNAIDSAIIRARHQVELVEEYRTRLIADVVTGKLDVRDAAAQLPDEAEDHVPIGEGDPQQNALVEGIYDTEEHTQELGIESEVTR